MVAILVHSCDQASMGGSKKKLVAYMNVNELFLDSETRNLAIAAGRGDVDYIQRFVDKGGDVNSIGVMGATPLYWALRKESIVGFRKLLELGATPNAQFDDGGSIIRWATRDSNIEFLKLALEFGADPNQRSSIANETPLFQTLYYRDEYGELAAMRLLLKYGADPNAQNNRGVPMIIIAANSSRFDAVYELLSSGADPTLQDNDGYSFIDFIRDKKSQDFGSKEISSWFDKCVKYVEQ